METPRKKTPPPLLSSESSVTPLPPNRRVTTPTSPDSPGVGIGNPTGEAGETAKMLAEKKEGEMTKAQAQATSPLSLARVITPPNPDVDNSFMVNPNIAEQQKLKEEKEREEGKAVSAVDIDTSSPEFSLSQQRIFQGSCYFMLLANTSILITSVADSHGSEELDLWFLQLTNWQLLLNELREIHRTTQLVKIARSSRSPEEKTTAVAELKGRKRDIFGNSALTYAAVVTALYWAVVYTPKTGNPGDHFVYHGLPLLWQVVDGCVNQLSLQPQYLTPINNDYVRNLLLALSYLAVNGIYVGITGDTVYKALAWNREHWVGTVAISIGGLVGVGMLTKVAPQLLDYAQRGIGKVKQRCYPTSSSEVHDEEKGLTGGRRRRASCCFNFSSNTEKQEVEPLIDEPYDLGFQEERIREELKFSGRSSWLPPCSLV